MKREKKGADTETSLLSVDGHGVRTDALRQLLTMAMAQKSSKSHKSTSNKRNRRAKSSLKSHRGSELIAKKKKSGATPSFVIEMDPRIASRLNIDMDAIYPLQQPTIAQRQQISEKIAAAGSSDDVSPQSQNQNSRDIGYSFGRDNQELLRSKEKAETTKNTSERSIESKRLKKLTIELEDISKIKESWQKRRDQINSSSASAVGKQKASSKLKKRLKRLSKPSKRFVEITKALDNLAPLMEEVLTINRERKKGKVLRPLRPRPYYALLQEEWNKFRKTDYRGVAKLPNTLKKPTVDTDWTPETIQYVSRHFSERRTSTSLLLLIASLAAAYTLYLCYDEYYYSNHPDVLESRLRKRFGTKGEILAEAARRRSIDEYISAHRNDKWGFIQLGWIPDFIRRWWREAQVENKDPLVYSAGRLYEGSISAFSNFDVSFFMNNSYFWSSVHAEASNFAEILAFSISQNGALSSDFSSSIPAISKALEQENVSNAFLEHGGLALLAHSTTNNSLSSPEALLLHAVLSTKSKVRHFWQLPEILVTQQLEALVLHTDAKTNFVSFAAAALTAHPIETITPYQQRLLVTIISRLLDPTVTTTDMAANCSKRAAKNFVKFAPSIANDGSATSIFVEKFKDSIRKETLGFRDVDPKMDGPLDLNILPKMIASEPSLAWLSVSLFAAGVHIWQRYDSSSLWNGLGALPLRTRKLQVLRRALPAFVIASSWLLIDAHLPRLIETWVQKPTDGGLSEGKRNTKNQNSSAEDSKRGKVQSLETLAIQVPIASLKIAFLWQYPFILAPQLISKIFLYPVSFFRQWLFEKREKQVRRNL